MVVIYVKGTLRGVSAVGCSIEIDIRIKNKEATEDLSIIDGSVEANWPLDAWRMHHVESINGRITLEACVVSKGVEATIDLDFLEVPAGGFHLRMSGRTARSDGFYSLTDPRRLDCNGFVALAGKHAQRFVAALGERERLRIHFGEGGREELSFVACKHGSEQQVCRFHNGAVVSVQVSWLTITSERDGVGSLQAQ